MKIQSERPERHVDRLTLRMLSTRNALKYCTLAPPRSYETTCGKIVGLMPEEQNEIAIDFIDTHELDELIGVLTTFRKQISESLGRWE